MLNSKIALAAMFAAFSFGAAAQQSEVRPFWDNSIGEAAYFFFDAPSTLSRAEVRGELQAALARGELAQSHGERGPALATSPSTRSRAEVLAELHEAARLGLVAYGEAGPPPATATQEASIAAAGKAAADSVAEARRNRIGG
jgi:hypothetical protein